MKPVGTGHWIRAILLCSSFVFVIYAMYSIRNHGLGTGSTEVLTGEHNAKVSSHVEICETRVKAVKTSEVAVFEKNMSWYKKIDAPGAPTFQLDPVAVEKWFGHNCSLSTENLRPVASNETQGALPVLTLDFIQGNPMSVLQTSSGNFIWKQFSFHSMQLEGALRDLSSLKEAGPGGRANPSED